MFTCSQVYYTYLKIYFQEMFRIVEGNEIIEKLKDQSKAVFDKATEEHKERETKIIERIKKHMYVCKHIRFQLKFSTSFEGIFLCLELLKP